MQLRYQQVAGPQFGGAINGINAANRSIADGIKSIGSGLTNLGQRKELRAREAAARADADALNRIKIQSIGVTDPNALAALGQGAPTGNSPTGAAIPGATPGPAGALPTGLGDFLLGREGSILANNQTRATTRGLNASADSTIEGTRGDRIVNDGNQDVLDKSRATESFNQQYSRTLLDIGNKAAKGDTAGAQADYDNLVQEASGTYGADIVSTALTNFLDRTERGDNVRTGVTTNALNLDGQRESNRSAGVTNRLNEQGKRTQNSVADYDFTRRKSSDTEDDLVESEIARVLNSTPSEQDAYFNNANNDDISPEVRARVASGVNAVFSANPGALNIFNPVDPLSQNVLDVQANNPANGTNFAGTADFVQRGLESNLDRSPAVRIGRDAASIEASFDGKPINLEQELRNREYTDKEINRITAIRANNGISEAETLAMLEQGRGRRGSGSFIENIIPGGEGGFYNILPGGKTRDDRVFDDDKFKQVVQTYTQQVSQGNQAARAGEFDRAAQRVAEIRTQAQEATVARARAAQSGDSQAVARYDQILENLSLEAGFIETNVANIESSDRTRPQSAFEKFLEPDEFTSTLIGEPLTQEQRRIRTARSLEGR